jgi:hypothetical protein
MKISIKKTYQKGEVFFYLLIFLLLIGAGLWVIRGNLYDLYQNYYQYVLFPNQGENSASKIVPKADTNKWNKVEYSDYHLTLKYPALWTVSGDKKISQFGIPASFSDQSVLNIITVSSHNGILVDGYYDQDLFYRIYNLEKNGVFIPEANNLQHAKFTKITSGKLTSGQPYVIFKQDRETGLSIPNTIQAYLLKGDSLIILTLSNYDQSGKSNFAEIVQNASIK